MNSFGSSLYPFKKTACFLFALFFPAIFISQTENSLVAKYTFNNANVNDETGRFNAEGLGISFVSDRFGNTRSSCFLHGNYSSYLNLGTAKELKPEKATISLWVKIDIPMLSGRGYKINPIIMTKSHKGDDFYEAYCMVYDWEIKKIVAATTLSERMQLTIHSTDTFPLREWHHIALTYDNDFTSLYIDGKLNVKMPKNFKSQFLETDSVMIGNTANTKNHRFLCASVDDIFLYNRVLTPVEINELYTAPDPNHNAVFLKWLYRGFVILIIIVVLALILVWRYKAKLERQKERDRINFKLHELETKAVRSQMNPHFLFNSLNTLKRFILEGNMNSAEEYIDTFSVLLRKLLESSVAEAISLNEELEILQKYVDIEKLRFENKFECIIKSTIEDLEHTLVPFMMVQPFVENSLLHGLLPSKKERRLCIEFSSIDEKRIKCIVDDNGVGREHSAQKKNPLKKKSLAIELIKQRMELIRKSSKIECGFEIIDKKNNGASAGTRVEIILPILDK